MASPTPAHASDLPNGLQASAVREVVERIAASTALGRSEQLVRFLRFVVEEALAGRGPLLKEYTIGVEALRRPPRFDPTSDSVVRVQARQLRFKLAEYFAGEGQLDRVRIELPKGSYVPVFSMNTAAAPSPSPIQVASQNANSESQKQRARFGLPVWLAATAFIVVAVVVAVSAARAFSTPKRSPGMERDGESSLVVLPFLNLTGNPNEDFVSDGVTDELTTALARTPGLRVVARTSAFQFKTRSADVRAIGRALGVDNVIEGSVQRTGGVLRITVQMNRARDGVHLWAASFDEPAGNVLQAEDAVARAVVDAVGRNRSPAVAITPPRLPTRDAEAYAAYLEARYDFNKRDPASLLRAITLFEDAIRRDSSFALAYAGLAGVHLTMAINGNTKPEVSPPLAERAARRALALDSTLSEPHAVLGSLRGFIHWDWAGADSEYQRAIQLGPNVASTHAWYATTLMARARLAESIEQLRYAQQLDPLSRPVVYSIGEALLYARRWNEAIAQAQTLLARNATDGGAYNLLWRVYSATGRYAEALDAMTKAHDSTSMPIAWAPLGRLREARERIAVVRNTSGDRLPYSVACLYAAVGDRDSAFVWLNRAYALHQADLLSMKVDPMMDPLRGDRRFELLLRRLGLAEAGDDTSRSIAR